MPPLPAPTTKMLIPHTACPGLSTPRRCPGTSIQAGSHISGATSRKQGPLSHPPLPARSLHLISRWTDPSKFLLAVAGNQDPASGFGPTGGGMHGASRREVWRGKSPGGLIHSGPKNALFMEAACGSLLAQPGLTSRAASLVPLSRTWPRSWARGVEACPSSAPESGAPCPWAEAARLGTWGFSPRAWWA